MELIKKGINKLGIEKLYDIKNECGRGRCVMLVSNWIFKILRDVMLGAVYSSFLAVNGFSMVEVSLLSVLTMLSSFCSILSPLILERFQKRKRILAGMKFGYYLLNLVALTVMPLLTTDRNLILVVSCILVFVSGVLNVIVTSGYSAWHLNFVKGEERLLHFSFQQISMNIVGSIMLFLIGVVVDMFTGTDKAVTAMFIIRMIAFLIGVFDVFILSAPKEYPYPQEEKSVKVANIFKLPFKNKKFMMTLCFMCIWAFGLGLTESVLYYYLQNDMGVSLKIISMNGIIYSIALIFLSGIWRKVIRKYSWCTAYGIAGLMHAPSCLLLILITPANGNWMYLLVCVIQGVAGVGLNLADLNMVYVNTPVTDQTYYIGFYNTAMNIIPLLGKVLATCIIGIVGESTMNLLGIEFNSVRWLLLIEFTVYVLSCLCFITNHRRLLPDKQKMNTEE